MDTLHCVLDHNFPPVPEVVKWPPTVRFSPLKVIDARLVQGYDDWQVLLALHQRGDVDAFVTQDANILALPTEMYVLSHVDLCLVVARDSGQSPIQAVGILMAGMDDIVRRVSNERCRILQLTLHGKPDSADAHLNHIAAHQRISPPELIDREAAKVGDLHRPVLVD